MIVYIASAVALVATGAVIGIIWVISLGVRREKAAASLTTPASDRLARAARVATGLSTRTSRDPAHEARRRDEDDQRYQRV